MIDPVKYAQERLAKAQAEAFAAAKEAADAVFAAEQDKRKKAVSNKEVARGLTAMLTDLIERGEFNSDYATELLKRTTTTAEEYREGYLQLLYLVLSEPLSGARVTGVNTYIFNATEYVGIDELEKAINSHMRLIVPDNLDSRYFRYMVRGVAEGDPDKRESGLNKLVKKVVEMSEKPTGFEFDKSLIHGDDFWYVLGLEGIQEPKSMFEGVSFDSPSGWVEGTPAN